MFLGFVLLKIEFIIKNINGNVFTFDKEEFYMKENIVRKNLFISTICVIAFSGMHSAMAYDAIVPIELSCKIRIASDDAFSGGRVAYGGINPVYEIEV